ncbi:MAG: GGDEF domain-containing protein [Burkholderiales bacterium]|nr:GGDEF domain-containing protein [Burkholderiales bacterium]
MNEAKTMGQPVIGDRVATPRRSGGVAGIVGAVLTSYVERSLGQEGLYALIKRVGAPTILSFIEEPDTWVDLNSIVATAVAASSLCFEPDIGRRAGEELVRVLGERALGWLGPSEDPAAGFEAIIAELKATTDLRTPVLADVEGDRAVIDVFTNPQGQSRFLCRMLVGVFAATPSLWDADGVTVENMCTRRGEDRCEFTAHWYGRPRRNAVLTPFVRDLERLRAWAETLPASPEGLLVGTVHAIEESALHASVPGHSLRDPLTGLANRTGFELRMADEYDRRGGSLDGFGLLFLDLDGFKPINDTHGHQVGDALLAQLGERLVGDLRSDDFVVRLGGDEFVVVAPLPDAEAAQRLMTRVRAVFDSPFIVSGRPLQVGCSLGVARAPEDGSTLEMLLERADAAMYDDKQKRHKAVGGLAELVGRSA